VASDRSETLYVESSALLRLLLEGDTQLAESFERFPRFLTSALTLVEVTRALSRARRDDRLTASSFERVHAHLAAFVNACGVVEITGDVRRRAALAFPVEPVRSLDAIHLATVLVWADLAGPMVLATCDDRIARSARALGFDVVPAA
jgi:predicted nucleic acid-binding protein